MFHLSFHRVSLHSNSLHDYSFAFDSSPPPPPPTSGLLLYRVSGGIIAWRVSL
jgi:hypothetical protein